MRYVAAYLLAVLGGKTAPSSADLEKILGSVGVEADGERLKKVIGELQGKSVDELIAQGLFTVKKLVRFFIVNFHSYLPTFKLRNYYFAIYIENELHTSNF